MWLKLQTENKYGRMKMGEVENQYNILSSLKHKNLEAQSIEEQIAQPIQH